MKSIVIAGVSFALLSGAALAQSSRDSDRRSERYGDAPQFIDPLPSQRVVRPGDSSPYAPVPGTANPYATVPGAPNPSDARIGAPNPYATTPGAPPAALGAAPAAQNQVKPTKPRHHYSDERMTPAGRASPDRAPSYSGRH